MSYNKEIFTNVNKYTEFNGKITYNGILVASKLNQKNGQEYALIDSIDIDWNNAWVSSFGDSTYLNTTEDLINLLNLLNRYQILILGLMPHRYLATNFYYINFHINNYQSYILF